MEATEVLAAPVAVPATNGKGPKMPRHDEWVQIDGYPGFEALIWTNAPQRLILDLDSGDVARYVSAYVQILTDTRTVTPEQTYPGWFDCDGDPLPSPQDPNFLEAVPTELVICARRTMREAVLILPNSLARRKPR